MPHRLRVAVETLGLIPTRPRWRRWSDNFRDAHGNVQTITHLCVSHLEWAEREEATDARWTSVDIGPVMLAYRILD